MITLERNTSNTVVVSVYEKTTISTASAKYLFVFKDAGMNTYNCICTVVTDYDTRQAFTIIDTSGTPDATNGEVSLGDNGFYEYKIYAQTSSTNTDPDLADELVEVGQMRLEGASVTFTEYGSSPTYITYGR
jgi:hypothetical protein